jgi:hypothetical protein
MRPTTTFRLALIAALIALAGAKVAARQVAPSSAPTVSKTTVATAQAPKGTTTTVKAKTSAAQAKASTKKKSPKKDKNKKDKKTVSVKTKAPRMSPPTTRSTSATAPTVVPWKPNNPVAEQLSARGTEVARVRRVLPSGADLNVATAGFRNYSQFAAAVNATESKGLDFWKLRALMTGINRDGTRTHQPTMSLSQAMQSLHGTATTPPGGA